MGRTFWEGPILSTILRLEDGSITVRRDPALGVWLCSLRSPIVVMLPCEGLTEWKDIDTGICLE